MSVADNQAISVLLPASSVAVYSNDQAILDSAQNLASDWRFARVSVSVMQGDISTAISAYQEAASPDLIIIQTETIEESLTQQLEDLAGHCDEGTAAIVVGPVNDVSLYRQLIEMGVSDYLVVPVETPVLADVIAKTLIERLGVTGSRLIAFLGAKGGMGATVLAEATAWGVSDLLDQKVFLMDGAGGWSSLGVGMGFDPSTTLQEAVKAAANNDEDSLERMLFKASEKLHVLASGGDVMLESSVAPEQLESLLDMLMAKYPVVIIDLSHAASGLEKAVITRANQIIVVSTPTLPALRLARSLVQEVKEVRGGGDDEQVELIVNMQGQDNANEVSKNDIEEAMELPISAIVPYAGKVFLKAESESKKLTEDKEGREIVQSSLLPIVQKVLSVDVENGGETSSGKSGFLDGFLGKLTAK